MTRLCAVLAAVHTSQQYKCEMSTKKRYVDEWCILEIDASNGHRLGKQPGRRRKGRKCVCGENTNSLPRESQSKCKSRNVPVLISEAARFVVMMSCVPDTFGSDETLHYREDRTPADY